MVNDPFKIKNPTYDSSINSFIYRVYDDRTGELVNITISDRAGNEANTSYISFTNRNPKKELKEIVELKKATQQECYKAIFNPDDKEPEKILHKKDLKDKWQRLVNPSQDIIDYISDQRTSLKSRRNERGLESPAIFTQR